MDTSLNDTGKKQAQRMGQALTRQLCGSNALFLHSKLKRSKETAVIAALQTINKEHEVTSHDTQQLVKVGKNNDPVASASATLVELPSIGEIDFGLQEGMSSASVLSEMYQIYSSWSVGLIDVGHAGGGETGREVCVCFEGLFIHSKTVRKNLKLVCISQIHCVRILVIFGAKTCPLI